MIVYHDSYMTIETPEILAQEKGRDFGPGFYTTSIREQAERWAVRIARLRSRRSGERENAVLNVYDYDERKASLLRTHAFPRADGSWLELVVRCRSDPRFCHGYDIVSGKIADDTVGETVEYVLAGIMRAEDALERLRFEKINDQICFCTARALQTLSFKESRLIRTLGWEER